jgi:Meiotically up-regulated gene 113
MQKKLNSSVVVWNEELYVSIDLLGYDNHGLLICLIDGIPLSQFEDEKSCFVKIADAIDMLISETNASDCNEAERNFRLLLVRELHGWKDKYSKGEYVYRFSDEFVISYECFWASRTNHQGRKKALRLIRRNRPDIFDGRSRRSKSAKDGYVDSLVYFVQGKNTKNIKIGFSRDPTSRIATLQCGSSEELVPLKWIRGGKPLEKELHEKFSHLRLHGEWFRSDPELIDYIGNLIIKEAPNMSEDTIEESNAIQSGEPRQAIV